MWHRFRSRFFECHLFRFPLGPSYPYFARHSSARKRRTEAELKSGLFLGDFAIDRHDRAAVLGNKAAYRTGARTRVLAFLTLGYGALAISASATHGVSGRSCWPPPR